jgi:hypothetical protein
MFDLLALMWLLIGDVVAFFALFGATFALLISAFDAWRGRSPFRAFRLTANWSIGALFLGILMLSSVMLSDEIDAPATLILGTSRLNIGIMLAASVALLVSSLIVSRLIRR